MSRVKTLSLIVIASYLALVQGTIVEAQRYPTLNIKTSITALDASYAFKLNFANKQSLRFDTNWGEILKEEESRVDDLPPIYKNTEILRIDTSQVFLELIAYGKQGRKKDNCIMTVWWDKNKRWTNRVLMSRDECLRLRVTRVPFELQKKLVSYITDEGLFRWFYVDNKTPRFKDWEEVKGFNLFENEVILGKDEPHDVAFYNRKTYDFDLDNDLFSFVVYQKATTKDGQYPDGGIWVVSTDKDFDEEGVSMSFSQLDHSYKSFRGVLGPIQKVHWVYGPDSNEHTTLVISSLADTGKLSFTHHDLKTDGEIPKELHMRKSSINSGHSGFLIEGREVTFYYEIDTKEGKIKLCKPKYTEHHRIFLHRLSSWKYSCVTKFHLKELNFDSEEKFIDDVEARDDEIIVIKIKDKGDQDLTHEIVYSLEDAELPEIDVEKNNYAANSARLYEVKEDFARNPQIYSYADPATATSYLFSLEDLIPEIKIRAWDSDNEEVFAEHIVDYNQVDEFVPDFIDSDNVIRINKGEFSTYNKPIALQDRIPVTGDYIFLRLNRKVSKTWFTLTPIERPAPIQPEKLRSVKPRKQAMKLDSGNLEARWKISSPTDVLELCNLKDYYVFAKDNRIHSFSKKIPGLENKYYYLVDLSEYNIKVGSFYCSKNHNYVIVDDFKDKYYGILSFDFGQGNGEYAIRQFYYELDLMDYASMQPIQEEKKYKMTMKNGEILYVHFNNLFPYVKIDEKTTKGQVKLFGETVQFMVVD